MKDYKITFNRFSGINEENPDKEYLVIRAEQKNMIIGELRVDEEDGHIEYIEISQQFRGKGFYKILLISALQVVDELISDDRNSLSNPIYKKWLNDDDLMSEDVVYIKLSEEHLDFYR